MSISFHPYVYDAATGFWKFPPAARQIPDSWEVNVSNANGAELLLAIGLNPDVDHHPMPIDRFSALITAALRRHLGHRSPELQATVHDNPGSMTIVHCGRREGYIEARLSDLATLAQRSRTLGATHIGWG
jgi:hypothetical protein